jgi:hypothetical protein
LHCRRRIFERQKRANRQSAIGNRQLLAFFASAGGAGAFQNSENLVLAHD